MTEEETLDEHQRHCEFCIGMAEFSGRPIKSLGYTSKEKEGLR